MIDENSNYLDLIDFILDLTCNDFFITLYSNILFWLIKIVSFPSIIFYRLKSSSSRFEAHFRLL